MTLIQKSYPTSDSVSIREKRSLFPLLPEVFDLAWSRTTS